MISGLAFVIGLTRVWAAAYTLGLAATVKDDRRAEIESDLWDQQRLASLQRESSPATAGHVFIRFFLGIPGDIAWRVETAFAAPQERTGEMSETWTSRLGLYVGLGLALLPILQGIGTFVGVIFGESEDSAVGMLIWGAGMTLGGAVIVAGLLLSRRTYGRGMALLAIGVVGLCLWTFWMAFITVPIGIVLLVLAHLRGRGTSSPQNPGATTTA